MTLRDRLFSSAWQPLTPRGVAAFSRASLTRVLLVQSCVALFAAGTVVWFLSHSWFPVVREAIQQLPAEGEIRRGELVWRGDSPKRLAANSFLSFSVDLWRDGAPSREAHVAVEFGRKDVRVHSLFGYAASRYPDAVIEFNRPGMQPWWGAWEPWLLVAAAVATVAGLMASWWLLGTAYAVVVWLTALYANRELRWSGCWKLAAAAMMPGTLIMTLGVFAYGLGFVDLIRLAVVFAVHWLTEWIYLFVSPFFLPPDSEPGKQKRNPFAG